MSREIVDVIRNLMDLFARGDVPTVLTGFHAEIVWHHAVGLQQCADTQRAIGSLSGQ
jgi:hypothetical protein